MEILLLIVGLVLFVSLVVVHEFGHFIMARRNGVEVEEFGIGFPPKMFTFYKDKKGTEYTWNWLPLGGFVRLKGEHDEDTEKGTFGSASFYAKTKIILAGVFMNLVTAWIMLTLLAFVGIPKLPLPGNEAQYTVASDTKVLRNDIFVGYVEPDGPADKAGIKTGDKLKGLFTPITGASAEMMGACENESADTCRANFQEIKKSTDLRSLTETSLRTGTKDIGILIVRDGKEDAISVSPRSLQEVADSEKNDNPVGYLGIQPFDYTVQRSTWSAPVVGAGLVAQFSKLTYQALGSSVVNLFQGKGGEASQNVSGPIGIFVVLREGASFGPSYVLLIIALLSLTLAIMNTLPIPALDGGKLAVMALFRVIKRPLTPQLEERIHGSGFVALMLLFVLITFVDIKRFF